MKKHLVLLNIAVVLIFLGLLGRDIYKIMNTPNLKWFPDVLAVILVVLIGLGFYVVAFKKQKRVETLVWSSFLILMPLLLCWRWFTESIIVEASFNAMIVLFWSLIIIEIFMSRSEK